MLGLEGIIKNRNGEEHLFSVYRRLRRGLHATLKKPIHIYIGGLIFSIAMMGIIGIYEVVSEGQKLVINGALAGMSGLGHIALSIGLVWAIVKIFSMNSQNKESTKVSRDSGWLFL